MAIFKKTTVAKAAAVKKPVTAPKKVTAKKVAAPKVSPEERQKMIEREAYFIAERQGFQGDPQAHWAEAVKRIDAILAKR
jgi:hypothetical protein